jgi:hypothetical protein
MLFIFIDQDTIITYFPTLISLTSNYCYQKKKNNNVIFFIFFYMSTQGKGERGFELVTSASLGVIYSQLNYPLETNNNVIK